MTPRERRAARELRGYLVRMFGPEASIAVEAMPARRQHADRVAIEATVKPAVAPADPGASRRIQDTPRHPHIVVEIAERYVSIRSARYALGGGLIPVTCDQVTEALTTEFRNLFPAGTLEIDVPWLELAWAAAESLAGHGVLEGVATTQLKQKFAQMRWHTAGIPDQIEAEVSEILDSASHLASVVCEARGAPGTQRPGGWLRILCDPCAEARGKKR